MFNKFPYIEGQPAEIFHDGKRNKGKIFAGYRFRDGVVTVLTEDGQKIWCGEARKELYREVKNKIVQSFSEVDVTELKFPAIAIYDRPSDYPKQYVARIFDSDKPTNIILLGDSLSKIREDIKFNLPQMVRLPRAGNDVGSLVETWI